MKYKWLNQSNKTMLVLSPRLVLVTKDASGAETRKVIRTYGLYEDGKAQADAEAMSKVLPKGMSLEVEKFLDNSLYAAGWSRGFLY